MKLLKNVAPSPAQAPARPGFTEYQEALRNQAKWSDTITALQARHRDLEVEAGTVREGLELVREEKRQAIRDLATGKITQTDYDRIKENIARLAGKLEEIADMTGIIEAELDRSARELSQATAQVRATKYHVIAGAFDQQADIVRGLCGDKIIRLQMLAAQMGLTDPGTQLLKIFNDRPDLNQRAALSGQIMRELFPDEV